MNDNRYLVRAVLASGEFEQTRNALQGWDSFCCLGVACLVAERHGVEVLRSEDGMLVGGGLLDDQPAVAAWLAIDKAEQYERVHWNDAEWLSFDQIAEVF